MSQLLLKKTATHRQRRSNRVNLSGVSDAMAFSTPPPPDFLKYTTFFPFMTFMGYIFQTIYSHTVRRRMLYAVLCFLCLSGLLFSFPVISASQAEKKQEPVIDEIVISATSGYLLLFATVKHCFTDEMLEGVRNGIPLTFRFDIRLNKIRKNWFDSELAEHKINHTLSYDPLKEEYQVAFAEKDRPEVSRSLEEAKQMMADLNGLRLYPLTNCRSDPRIP